MIRDFQPRLYQQTILGTAVKKNTLVVLPTGMGKTFIFLMLADYRLRLFPNSKVLMLAPTKPLAQQHMMMAEKHLELPKMHTTLLTGAVPPAERAVLWEQSNLIFSTPQTIENDIVSERISLKKVCLICFDECHRAVGDYSYVWIADQFIKTARFPHVLGLTASPGSEVEKIYEICKNLHIEAIEVRTLEDPDMKPYIQEVKVKIEEVELPKRFKLIRQYLEACFGSKISQASKLLGSEYRLYPKMSKKDILLLQRQLHSNINPNDFSTLRAISLIAEGLKVQHALELLETQGSFALHSYMSRLVEDSRSTKVKAVKNLVADQNFKAAMYLVEQLTGEGIEHPKIDKLIQIISKRTDKKMIVFNQYRDSAKRLVATLNQLGTARARLFVGQAKKGDTGLSQKHQKEMIEQFKAGDFNVLVSTSIGEEGLDIPRVDLVIFYEPVPSAIRSIQRRGRTGRQKQGQVILLVTKGTRDVAYKWSSYHKERHMYSILNEIKNRLKPSHEQKNNQQSSLNGYVEPSENRIKLIADTRERGSPVLKGLTKLGVHIELKQVNTADYICSKDCAIEFKTNEDFVSSIIDRRLLLQAKRLRENFTKPIILIQESQTIPRGVNKRAVYGAIASLALGFQIPLIHTKSPAESAELIYSIAKYEQAHGQTELSLHFNKPLSLKEQQEYLVSALPGIGPRLAVPLLKRFGSVKAIVNATEKELQEVRLIGKKKSSAIKAVLERYYNG